MMALPSPYFPKKYFKQKIAVRGILYYTHEYGQTRSKWYENCSKIQGGSTKRVGSGKKNGTGFLRDGNGTPDFSGIFAGSGLEKFGLFPGGFQIINLFCSFPFRSLFRNEFKKLLLFPTLMRSVVNNYLQVKRSWI